MKLTVFHRDFIHQTIQLCWERDCQGYIGTSLLLFEGMKMDAKGSFCPMSLIAPEDMQSLFQLFRDRKLEEAFAVQEKVRRGGCTQWVSYSAPFNERTAALLARAEAGGWGEAAPIASVGC